MFSYYLLESAYHAVDKVALQSNLMELNEVMVKYTSPSDEYYYSDNFWSIQMANNIMISQGIFSLPNQQFCRLVLPKLLKRLHTVSLVRNYADLCASFPQTYAAFWGVNFSPKYAYDLSTKKEVETFRTATATARVNAGNLVKFKSVLFKRIVLCDSAYKFLPNCSSVELSQIITRLLDLDKYNQTWVEGVFAPSRVTQSTSLRVSYESESTNNNPKTNVLRWFQLPNGKTEYFEPHIKMGKFRIHFYPDNSSRIIYVGYIGPHLPI